MSLRVIRPGLQTTIQDLGRFGMQQYGVIVSGAMDSVAYRIANMLVGNPPYEAALEITLSGPQLLFECDAMVALGGADLSPTIEDRPLPAWRPIWIREGSLLDFGAPRRGCRTYLSIAGGFDVPQVMNSRSTVSGGRRPTSRRPLVVAEPGTHAFPFRVSGIRIVRSNNLVRRSRFCPWHK